jgi:hypothetical protein
MNTTAAEKIRVHVQFQDGRRVIVMPRSKKTSLFTSWEKAEKALNSYSKRLSQNAMGIMTGCTTGETRHMAI